MVRQAGVLRRNPTQHRRGAAFGWLEHAYGERTTRIQELAHPCFDRLRADPRFGDLMRRIGLPF
jgi:hypothetical protein